MSIKTIGQQTQSNTKGLEKIINKGAERLVIDVLQSTQYSTPIPSTIRELVTNACDSQREKEIAVEILTGKAQVSDYFITRKGDEYEDSNFDPSYYDLKHLDLENNKVRVNYLENDEGTGYCDTVEIIDYGVGIGERRLEGMLELGYSTKRNTAENFGAFGLGSKIALSTGVSHYTIETAHNGKLFKMNCHPYKTDFLISKWDADGDITLSNGEKAYYKNVTDKNYTKISFGSKKHNRRAFDNAVREQLSYINNVDYFTQYSSGTMVPNYFNKEILINTPSCIVSEGSSWYVKPHIVIVKNPGDTIGINYGTIDFRELEMEDLHGNIGIKCPMRQSYIDDNGVEIVLQDGVDVTPSREKVIWNDNTKRYVQGMLEQAAKEASEIIQEALKEDDFVKWIKLCTNILYKNTSSDGLSNDLVGMSQIAKMVDTSKIRPMFKDSGIRFAGPKKMMTGYRVRYIKRVGNTIQRTELDDWTSADLSRVYVADEGGASKTKDLYLTMGDANTFVLISPLGTDYLADEIWKETRPEIVVKLKAEKAKYESRKQTISELLETQSASVHNYSSVEISEDVLKTLNKIEEQKQTQTLTPAEQRKLQQKTVMYSLRKKMRDDVWVWDKVEPKIETVLNSTIPTFYGSTEDAVKIKYAARMLESRVPKWLDIGTSIYGEWERSPILFREAVPSNTDEAYKFKTEKELDSPQIVRIATNNFKYAEKNPNWKHIDEFYFTTEEDGSIVASEYLKAHLTATHLHNKRSEIWTWLSRRPAKSFFGPASDIYNKLDNYIRRGRVITHGLDRETIEFVRYLNSFIEYQDICDSGDVSLRQQKSRELFVVDVPSIDAYDKDLFSMCGVFDDLSEHIGYFMSFGTDSNNTSHYDEIYKIIFDSYNKFDIEVPEIEVPDLRFKFYTSEANTDS